jgi:cysteine synthase B
VATLKGDKLIEATSGNTGIALAMIAQLMNIEIELILQRFYQRTNANHEGIWTTVILTPAKILGSGYADKKVAEEAILC